MILRIATLSLILCPALTAQEANKAEEAFKAMEAKLAAVKTLSVSVKLEFDFNGTGVSSGTMLLGESNKFSVELKSTDKGMSEDMQMTAISDGARLKRLDRDKFDGETPKELNANIKSAFARMGTPGVGFLLAEFHGTKGADLFVCQNFAGLAKEKLNDKETTVFTYEALINGRKEDPQCVKVWVDSGTGLPVKRVYTQREGTIGAVITETYSSMKADDAIDARKFEFPK